MKKSKLIALILMLVCLFSVNVPVFAESAPPLTKVQITDLTFDENMQLHIEVTEIGTSRGRYVWANNVLCEENINETQYLYNYSNISYGAKRYFKVKDVYAIEGPNGLTTNKSGQSYTFRVKFTNAMYPWDDQSTSITITLP